MELIQDPQTGQWFQAVGRQLVPYNGPTPDQMAQGRQTAREMGALGAAGMNIVNALGGQYLPESIRGTSRNQFKADIAAMQEAHPYASAAGTIGAAIPGAILAGPSIAGQALLGAGMGALSNADNPWQAAATGGALGGAFGGLLKVGGAAVRGELGSLPGLQSLENLGGKFADAMATAGMPNRVVSNIMGATGRDIYGNPTAAGSGNRLVKGLLSVDEADLQGLALTPGQKMALEARSPEAMKLAKRVMRAEEMRRTQTQGGPGQVLNEIKDSQLSFGTQKVKQFLGIDGEELLTPEVIGDTFRRVGQVFDNVMDEIGSVPISNAGKRELDFIIANATGPHKGLVQGIVDDALEMARKTGGELTAKDWQAIRTRIGKGIDQAGKQGDRPKISDLADVMEVFTQEMEGALGATATDSLKQARAQYHVLKKLVNSDANISATSYEINPVSFARSLRSNKGPSAFKSFETDDLRRSIETVKYITSKLYPSSGTMERMLANPQGTAWKAAQTAGITGGMGALLGGN